MFGAMAHKQYVAISRRACALFVCQVHFMSSTNMIYYCRGSFGNNSCQIWGAKMVTSLVAAPFSAHVAQLDFFL